MDVAATLINYLDEASSIPWYHNSPQNAPVEYGTLNRDGGAYDEFVRDQPTITLIIYASTRGRAAVLANSVKRALIASKWAVDNVFNVSILSDYYDPLDGKHRHRITASLVVND